MTNRPKLSDDEWLWEHELVYQDWDADNEKRGINPLAFAALMVLIFTVSSVGGWLLVGVL